MNHVTRRTVLTWAALAGALPAVLVPRADAARRSAARADRYDGRVVIVVRMMGGNDGLNTIVPVRDDRYYAARPTIAIARADTISLAGGELGLHAGLADLHDLMQQGRAGIVQSVGYPQSSRSHARATEIWETGSAAPIAPPVGWLGNYLDTACACDAAAVAGVQFGDTLGTTLASQKQRARLIGHPSILSGLDAEALRQMTETGPSSPQFAALAQSQAALADAAGLIEQARSGSSARHAYPDTAFGHSLRLTADMIEAEAAPRAYYLSIGSFADGAASFDTHVDQLPQHELLYRELGRGLRAFAEQLVAVRAFERVLLLTFSDFGRLLPENRTRGTEHGDASVLLYAGGGVRPGLLGEPANLGDTANGGVRHTVDFRSIYADVLHHWLGAPTTATHTDLKPFSIVAPTSHLTA